MIQGDVNDPSNVTLEGKVIIDESLFLARFEGFKVRNTDFCINPQTNAGLFVGDCILEGDGPASGGVGIQANGVGSKVEIGNNTTIQNIQTGILQQRGAKIRRSNFSTSGNPNGFSITNVQRAALITEGSLYVRDFSGAQDTWTQGLSNFDFVNVSVGSTAVLNFTNIYMASGSTLGVWSFGNSTVNIGSCAVGGLDGANIVATAMEAFRGSLIIQSSNITVQNFTTGIRASSQSSSTVRAANTYINGTTNLSPAANTEGNENSYMEQV